MVGRAWKELLVARLQVSLRLYSRVFGATGDRDGSRPGIADVERLVAVFDQAVATCPLGATCLPRSVALLRYLRRHGVTSRLHLGARKAANHWSGHAWVERNGQILGDREERVRMFTAFRQTA